MVYIVDYSSTIYGRICGIWSDYMASDLASLVIQDIVSRFNYPIDLVILGNVIGAGNGQNLARQALLKAKLSTNIPAFTVNQVCISPIKALQTAYVNILTGEYDVVIAGGVESMTNAPFLVRSRLGNKYGDMIFEDSINTDGLRCAISNKLMIELAEWIAKKYSISRDEQDELAYNSHKRAAEFWNTNPERFIKSPKREVDENIRFDVSLDKLSSLRPVVRAEDSSITAGNASSLADGASVLLIASEKTVVKYNLKPLCRIVGFAESFDDPKNFPIVPSISTNSLLKKFSLKKEDIDLWEINEAFACVLAANMKILGLDYQRTNIFGGAIAFGHPIGATGARLVINSILGLKKYGYKRAVIMVCAGSGGGYSMLIENI
ncbi:MAG: thiolase family protein [Candidatus Calescibacterium sp.]|nr:thiolase family protein [Candidatus Calescibacterium sp.]MCX7972190.1 thiolase family protein [bacterium]MDW8194880.1 thiolase family protein [Candidatus Calescibacterium sp.]